MTPIQLLASIVLMSLVGLFLTIIWPQKGETWWNRK
jgi:hypothetical protein